VITLYLQYKQKIPDNPVARTFIFAGKAAPGYEMAKRVIHLINAVGHIINQDPITRHILQCHFIPNYSVSVAERIIPATDISEQISTAGMEASGTGNMKFAMNGALTVGTLDGANIEILEAVGRENMFIFGLTAENVEQLRKTGYDPLGIYFADRDIRAALDAIANGLFSPEDPNRFRPIVDSLMHHDPFLVLADFRSYASCQRTVEKSYRDTFEWTRRSILNVAHMGRFSSDKSIENYAREIWNVPISTL
jgi:starch phosphorylase